MIKRIFNTLKFCTAIIVTVISAGTVTASNSVDLIVPYQAGGGTDLLARILQPALSAEINKTVVVKYQLGGGGEVAAASLARNNDRALTLLLHSVGFAVQNSSAEKNYNWETDFKYVAWLGHVPMVLVSNDRWPYKNLNDLSTAKSLVVNYGSSGVNTASHINGELLALHFGRDFTHIPYKGASAVIPNLLGYQIDISFNFLSSVQPYIESNKLIPLAVVNDTRIDSLPDTPTFQELGIDQPWLRTWYVLLANKNADEKEIAKVQQALKKILKQPATQKILKEHGYIIKQDQITMSKTMVSNEIKSFSKIKNKISGAK